MNNPYTIMLIFLVILLLGVGYGLWSSSLKANVYVYMLQTKLEIGSWKVFAIYPDNKCRGFNDIYLSQYNDTLHVLIGNNVVNYMWIGLVIENNKGVIYDLNGISVVLNDSLGEYNVTPLFYLYEPIKTGIGNQPYWDGVKCGDLPVDGYSTVFPLSLKSGYKMVAWIYLELGLSNTEITVKIISHDQ
ncbi:MAG: hypothetical protein ACPLQS_01420 [Desulfurococcaceae archaeon]